MYDAFGIMPVNSRDFFRKMPFKIKAYSLLFSKSDKFNVD